MEKIEKIEDLGTRKNRKSIKKKETFKYELLTYILISCLIICLPFFLMLGGYLFAVAIGEPASSMLNWVGMLFVILNFVFEPITGIFKEIFYFFPSYLLWITVSQFLYSFYLSTYVIVNEEKHVPDKVKTAVKYLRVFVYVFTNLFFLYRIIKLVYDILGLGFQEASFYLQLLPLLVFGILILIGLMLKSSDKKIVKFLISYWGLIILFLVVTAFYVLFWTEQLLMEIYPLGLKQFFASLIVYFLALPFPTFFLWLYKMYASQKID